MKKVLLSIVLLMGATAVFSQPRVNDDGTVTFRYKNDSAKVVMVDVQFAGRNEMKRGDDGIWTATLGPAEPDMYPYCFIVDGVSVMDPGAGQYFPNEGFKNSLLEIPSKAGALAHDIKNVVYYHCKEGRKIGRRKDCTLPNPPGPKHKERFLYGTDCG